jgi:hypothetical protein
MATDYLGYGVYAQTLWNRIEAALNKDQGNPKQLGDDPLVVGIFGEWGGGEEHPPQTRGGPGQASCQEGG